MSVTTHTRRPAHRPTEPATQTRPSATEPPLLGGLGEMADSGLLLGLTLLVLGLVTGVAALLTALA